MTLPTVLDVLDNAFGGRPPEAPDELAEAVELLEQFWRALTPRAPNDPQLRLRGLGMTGPWSIPATAGCRDHDDLLEYLHPSDAATRRSAAALLITAEALVDTDPLSSTAAWFSSEEARANPTFGELMLRHWDQVQRARPLIEGGLLHLVPVAPVDMEYLSNVVQDEGDGWYSRFSGWEASEQIRLRHDVETARRSFASIVPTTNRIWSFLVAVGALQIAPSARLSDANVAAAFAAASLPILDGLDMATMVKVHRDDAFTDFREALREVASGISTLPIDADYEHETKALFQAHVDQKLRQLTSAVSRSRTLRRALSDEPVRVMIGASAGVGWAEVAGKPPRDAVVLALLGAIGNVGFAAIRKPRPDSATAVLALIAGDTKGKGAQVTTRIDGTRWSRLPEEWPGRPVEPSPEELERRRVLERRRRRAEEQARARTQDKVRRSLEAGGTVPLADGSGEAVGKLCVHERDGMFVLALHGNLVFDVRQTVEAALRLIDEPHRSLVIDLAGVTSIDSAVFSCLIGLHVRSVTRCQTVVVVCPAGELRAELEGLGLLPFRTVVRGS